MTFSTVFVDKNVSKIRKLGISQPPCQNAAFWALYIQIPVYSENQSSLGGNEISGLKLATDLRLKRIYHCWITDVGEGYDLRIIIHKSIGGQIVKTNSSEIAETN